MMAVLAQFTVPEPNYPSIVPAITLSGETIFLVFDVALIIGLGIFLFWLIRLLLRSRLVRPAGLTMAVLQVTIPKESAEAAEHEDSIEQIRSHIALAESWLGTLGGLRAQRGWRPWFIGRTDQFALEIVLKNNLITFYVAVPRYLQSFMEQQILAQYPEANLTEVEDYNIFLPDSHIVSGYLRFTRNYIFPLKTYRTLASDPLNALTNSLSSAGDGVGIAVQLVCRSAKKRWHRRGYKVAGAIQRGKPVNEALSSIDPLSLHHLFGLFSFRSAEQAKDDKMRPAKQLSPMEQESVKGLEEKTAKAGLDCNIRIVAAAPDRDRADRAFRNVIDSFNQFNYYQYGNSLKTYQNNSDGFITDFIHRAFREHNNVLLNTEELASIFHLPTPFLETPNIRWLLAKKLAPPSTLPADGLLIGENIFRGSRTNVHLTTDDRRRHTYVIGMTGTGKSVLLANMAIQDIRNGRGVCVIDPHGSLVESILPNIPKERINDVIYFNPADTERPLGLNMLEAKTTEQQDFVTQEMIAIFYKLVTDPTMIGPVFEHNMRNAMFTLMADREYPGTVAEIPRLLTDRNFQKYKIAKVTDPMVRSFWEQEMAQTSDFHKSETLGYLISKVGRFVENAMVRNIIGQPRSGFNFREVMDKQKILLVNLSKGKVGEVNANLLGLILVAKLQLAALSRTDIPEDERHDFYLYIDEFQNFITDSISTIMAEARKYKLNLILAHQYIGQLTQAAGPEGKSYGDKIKDSIFGNVGTIVSFRIGVDDAELIAKQMAPVVDEYDLINLEQFNAYARLLVDNQPLKAFNIRTFPPSKGDQEIVSDIIEFSRWRYGIDRRKIEAEILERTKLGAPATAIKTI